MKQTIFSIVLFVFAVTFTHVDGEMFEIQSDLETEEIYSIEGPVAQAVKECSLNEGAEAGRRFAYKLYQVTAMKHPKRNLFLAPSVVRMSLAMILHGAKGATRSQIIQGLQFKEKDFSEDNLRCLMKLYSEDLDPESRKKEGASEERTTEPPAFVIKRVGRLFGERTFAFNKDFVEKAETYGTKLEMVDFMNSTEDTRTAINDWVEQATNKKIKDLFKASDIGGDTKLAVASAIYFQGNWKYPFNENLNFEYNFTLWDGGKTEATFMSNEDSYHYYRDWNTNADVIEVPYRDDPNGMYKISLILLVPDSVEDLEKMQLNLTEEYLGGKTGVIKQLLSTQIQRVRLVLPKFRLTADYDLTRLLPQMGIKDMFRAGQADLSGMVDQEANLSQPLYVSSAVHKTFIKVDERGTEAAGSAGFGITQLSLPLTVFCDKPFFTIIYEHMANEILFIGKVINPNATG